MELSGDLKNGDLIWLNLLPYFNKRVLCKYIDFKIVFEYQDYKILPFTSYFLVFDEFYDELSYSKSIKLPSKLFMSPVNLLTENSIDVETMEIIGNKKIISNDIIFPDLRVYPKELKFCNNLENPKYQEEHYSRSYEVISFDGQRYINTGERKIEECGHLHYDQCLASSFWLRSLVSIVYAKKHYPSKLNIRYYGKLNEGLNDDRYLFNQYSKLFSFQHESIYKFNTKSTNDVPSQLNLAKVFNKYLNSNREPLTNLVGVEYDLIINEKLEAQYRIEEYEDPIDKFLKRNRLGKVIEGKTILLDNMEVNYCLVKVFIYKLTNFEGQQRTLKTLLNSLMAPKGSQIICKFNETKIDCGIQEGIGIYLDGSNLQKEIYEDNDINVLASIIIEELNINESFLRFWEKPGKTALYFYSESYDVMAEKIRILFVSYPLLTNCIIKRIA